MSGRDSVYRALVDDSNLNSLGIASGTVFPNYSMDQRPVEGGAFIILRWEDQPFLGTGTMRGRRRGKGGRNITIWVHIPKSESSDFTKIDAIHDRVEEVLTSMEHSPGTDGYTVTCIEATGRGGDLRDDGFDTITRNAGYRVLSRLSS